MIDDDIKLISTDANNNNDDASVPWVKKYRPRTLDDVCYQEEAVDTLKNVLKTGNLPHLLFYGPPGTGKTSSILALARQLFGPELYKQRVLELNASNERGIDIVRHKVKDFASITISKRKVEGYPCPPFKIVILDEADSMTKQAQSALRRTMEVYTDVTRFCIICNYVSRIIDPITSRCAKFRFRSLSNESMQARIMNIASKEQITVTDDNVNYLLDISQGDMRKAITLLQSTLRLAENKVINKADIDVVACTIPAEIVKTVLSSCKANAFLVLQEAATNIIAEAYPVDNLLDALLKATMEDSSFTDIHKGRIAILLAETQKNLVDGADEFLQVLHVLSEISRIIVQ